MNKRQTGSSYEDMAAAYLIEHGYEIIERNYRDRSGEIDIIARDESYLVFIEVKYRSDTKKGYPAESVGPGKQRHIRNTARYYLFSHHYGEGQPCRFDVVSILGQEIELIRNAFS